MYLPVSEHHSFLAVNTSNAAFTLKQLKISKRFSCNWHFVVSKLNLLFFFLCRHVYQNENLMATKFVMIFRTEKNFVTNVFHAKPT